LKIPVVLVATPVVVLFQADTQLVPVNTAVVLVAAEATTLVALQEAVPNPVLSLSPASNANDAVPKGIVCAVPVPLTNIIFPEADISSILKVTPGPPVPIVLVRSPSVIEVPSYPLVKLDVVVPNLTLLLSNAVDVP
jgi:hypothetical protein